jgi:hypothetical protein
VSFASRTNSRINPSLAVGCRSQPKPARLPINSERRAEWRNWVYVLRLGGKLIAACLGHVLIACPLSRADLPGIDFSVDTAVGIDTARGADLFPSVGCSQNISAFETRRPRFFRKASVAAGGASSQNLISRLAIWVGCRPPLRSAHSIVLFGGSFVCLNGVSKLTAVLTESFGTDEFGHQNTNLHCHAIFCGPWLPNSGEHKNALSELWGKACEHTVFAGSFIVSIKLAESFEKGLAHALKYTGKYMDGDPDRLADLELAFDRVRRVHTLRAFYNALPKDKKSADAAESGCPTCGAVLVRVGSLAMVRVLAEHGCADLDVARQDAGRAKVFSRAGPDLDQAAGGVSVYRSKCAM